MLTVEVIDLIDGWRKQQAAFLKVEFDLWRKLLILSGDVKQ